MLISDDVSNNLAFRDFCMAIDSEPIIVSMEAAGHGTKYQGVLVKGHLDS